MKTVRVVVKMAKHFIYIFTCENNTALSMERKSQP